MSLSYTSESDVALGGILSACAMVLFFLPNALQFSGWSTFAVVVAMVISISFKAVVIIDDSTHRVPLLENFGLLSVLLFVVSGMLELTMSFKYWVSWNDLGRYALYLLFILSDVCLLFLMEKRQT